MTATRSFAILVLLLAGCAGRPAAVPAATATLTTAAPRPSATTRPAIPATGTPAVLPTAQASTLPVLPLTTPCHLVDQPVSFSSHRTWAMAACQGASLSDGTSMRVLRMDGTREWDISFKDSYIKPYMTDFGPRNDLLWNAYIPAGWTSDEQFAYLAVQTSNAELPYPGYDALFRLDLSTGKLTPTLKPAIGHLTTDYVFRFSPGGSQLAYVNQNVLPLRIVIYNLASGTEQSFSLDGTFGQAGSFLWSPDEKQLVFAAGDSIGDSVILFDLVTMKNEYLVKDSAHTYLPRAWAGDTSLYSQDYPSGWVYLDTQTKTITPAPAPTPMP